MIHTANEFTAQHHRYLVSGTNLGLHSMGTGGAVEGSAVEAAGKAGTSRRAAPGEASKASTGFALGGDRCAPQPSLWGHAALRQCWARTPHPLLLCRRHACRDNRDLGSQPGMPLPPSEGCVLHHL